MPSTSAKQHRFMAAIAHNPSFAKKVGVKQSVGKDFAAADKGKIFNKGGMMAKIKRYNGATADGSDIYSDRDEYPEAQEVERKTFAGGVRMSPSYLTKPASAAPYRMSQANKDEPARNEATIERDAKVAAANARDNDNMASNVASNKASSAYQNTMRKAAATNERQAAQARASDDGKDYSGNGFRTAGKASEAIAAGALATVATLAGQPQIGGAIISKAAIPAARQVLSSVLRSNRTTGAEKAGEGAARAVAKEADRIKNTPNTTASAVKPGGNRELSAKELINQNPGVYRTNRNVSQKELDKLGKSNEARFKDREAKKGDMSDVLKLRREEGLKKGGTVKESKAMVGKEVAFFKKKGAPASMMKHEKAEMKGMKMGGMPMKFAHGGKMPMKDGKPTFLKGMNMGGMAKYAKGGGIESRGKTKGTIIRMASGGSVSSASRRADGIAQRGKTRC